MGLLDAYSQQPDQTTAVRNRLVIQGLDDASVERAQKRQDLSVQAAQNQRAQAEADQKAAEVKRQIDARTASSEFGQWATDPATAGKGFNELDPDSKNAITTKYPGIAREIPGLFNEAQAAASGNPMTGIVAPPNTQVSSKLIPGIDATQKLLPKPNRALDTMGARLGVEFPADATDDEKQTIIAQHQQEAAAAKAAPVDLNDDQQKLAEAIARYDVPPNQALGRITNPAVREKIMSTAADLGYDAKEYPTKLASRRDFTSGQSARSITSLNTVIHHLGSALEAYKKMGNFGSPMINAPYNYVAKNAGGNAHITAFQTNADAVAEEMAKLLKGGVATKSEIDEWRGKLDSSLGPAQLNANVGEMMRLLAGRVDGLRNQWQSAYLKPRDLPFIDADAQKVLQAHGFDPGAIDPAAKGSAPAVPAGTAPGPVAAGGKPQTVRQNGVTYTLQSDGSYK